MRMAELYPDEFIESNMGTLENQLARYIVDVSSLVVIPIICIGVRKFGRYLRELSYETQAAASYEPLIDASLEIKEADSLHSALDLFTRVENLMIPRSDLLVNNEVVGLFSGGLSAASTLSIIVVVIYGAYLAIRGSMTAGSLTSFILYSGTVGPSISSQCLHTTAMKAEGASGRVFRLLDCVSSMSTSGDKCPISCVPCTKCTFFDSDHNLMIRGTKAAAVACVASAIPTLVAIWTIPWAKANLDYAAQGLIISAASIAAYFITADKTILECTRINTH
ncbi:Early nodulin-93 [Capsicum annuum]|nr:Early nodulin-93 [Capsicum annuum]KAF3679322.1 Early nodulin-93 [Capsicum annuum]